MSALFGMKVMTSAHIKPVPVLQLRPDFNACTDAFKIEMNKWLLEMFDAKEVVHLLDDGTLFMSPAMFAKIKQEACLKYPELSK